MVAMTLPAKPWTNGMMTADGTRMFDSSVGSEGAWRATPIAAGGLPAGSVINWSSNTLPPNWLLCDGSAVSRTLYPSLYAAIGTTYGSGDGSTTFNVPDIPNGDAGGIVGSVKLNSSVSITTTDSDLSGLTQTIPMKAGRSYEIMLSAPNMPSSNGTNRANIRFVVDGSVIDGHYTNATSGGLILTARTIYTPTTDGSKTVKMKGVVDLGGGTITLYADLSSSIYFTVTDLGESTTSLRQRSIIKATTGWSAGDSELALRMAAVETANSTTNKSGLVPVIPTSVVKDAGTVSVNANGKITFSGVTTLRLNGLFSANYTNYRFAGDPLATTTSNNLNFRFCVGGVDQQDALYLGWGWYLDYNSGGFDTGQSVINQTTGKFGYAYAGTGTMLMGDIMSPFLASKPTAILNHQINGGTMWWRGGFYNKNIGVDGITLIFPNPSSGSFTFYGYKD